MRNFIQTLYLYLLTVPVFLGLDMIWLGLVTKNFYSSQIGQYLKPTPNWTAATLFYLLYIVGILIFAVLPNLDKEPLKAAMYGALFGFFTYATYDLTNYSTLKDWPLTITVVDIVWGTLITCFVALISYFIAKLIY